MLPSGFQWSPHVEAHGLLFEGRLLAYVEPLDAGCRVGFLARGTPHYEFRKSVDAGVRLVETWARKWEAEIRAQHIVPAFDHLALPPLDPERAKEVAARDMARRRGRKGRAAGI